MRPGPGKFEACGDSRLADVLYGITLESGCVEEIGSVDELGWYGIIENRDHAYIVEEDSQGFFDYTRYDTIRAAHTVFSKLWDMYDEYYHGEDEE